MNPAKNELMGPARRLVVVHFLLFERVVPDGQNAVFDLVEAVLALANLEELPAPDRRPREDGVGESDERDHDGGVHSALPSLGWNRHAVRLRLTCMFMARSSI
jgi:hypothetical protein